MSEYDRLNRELLSSVIKGRLKSKAEYLMETGDEQAAREVETLLHPEDKPLVVQFKDCGCSASSGKAACEISCLFDSIQRGKDGKLIISSECVGCGRCIEACSEHVLEGRKDAVPLLEMLRKKEKPVYAMIAPAFSGQFSSDVTSGKLRTAFKCLGFYGMMEVALFADILTLKEALEFDRAITHDEDFLLTSCCCPMWVALIRKKYEQLVPHVPPSVSPMVACGRAIKKIHPEAVTVFIGPCLAKKAEAREPDIADAVDYVLTFDEVAELFELLDVGPEDQPEDHSDQSSRGGRIYARTSGVSEAVETTLARLRPGRKIPLVAEQADGIIACKELLKKISEGELHANFIEGMGCRGGCIGGPKVLIDKEKAREFVNRYGDEATSKTPAENENVLDILHRLGFTTVESLLDRDNTFTRNFNR